MVRALALALACVAMMLGSAGAVLDAHAEEVALLVCELHTPPAGSPPGTPAQFHVAGCEASLNAGVICPAQGTSCAEGLRTLLTTPGFTFKAQTPGFAENTVYTVIKGD